MAANASPEPLQLVRKTVWDEVPLIISHMPRQFPPGSEDAMGAWITAELDRIMDEYLVQGSERECWTRRGEQDLTPALLAQLDELIIRQTENLGDLIEHSVAVQGRIQAWKVERGGDDLYRQYNAARDKNMLHLHRRGGALPPIDPRFKQFKSAAVGELRIVLQDLRGHFASFRRKVKQTELLDRFRDTIAQSGCTYLRANQPSWEAFLTTKTRNHTIENLLERKPAPLFDEWAGWATTYKPEVLRQKISRQKK